MTAIKKNLRLLKTAAVVALACSVCLMSSCRGGHGASVIIAGSTSVQPYAEILAEEFTKEHPEIKTEIEVQGGGTATGIAAAISGTADIGTASRSLKAEEKEQLHYVVEIAKDGLAIIVHPNNPINDLTAEQIKKIYTRQITNWRDLGGRDAGIHVITREDGSGTRSAFEDLVMGKGSEIDPRAIVQNSNGAVRLLVSDDPNSIGFISLGLAEPQPGQKPVKALRLGGIAATRENVVSGDYKLYRPFLFVAKAEPEGVAKEFVDFVLSPRGQEMLANEGLIPEK